MKNERLYLYDNEQLARLIDIYVRGERDRAILKRRLIDLICYEPLAEEFGLSTEWARKIVDRAEKQLFKHI
jgi:hypothetical protein